MSRRREVLLAFDALAPTAEVAAALCLGANLGRFQLPTPLNSLCTAIGLPQSRAAEVENVLEVLRTSGLFERMSALNWRAVASPITEELAPLLQGVALYKERVHRDRDMVDVVLTKPPAPSQMAAELDKMLAGAWGLRDTRELLPAIAEAAQESFTVATPYLDEVGASIVLNLFERTAAQRKTLVLRCAADGQPPPGLAAVREELLRLNVSVLNFRLDRREGGGNETFHAKVVLADSSSVYVGSANMHRWSFEYSLELGVYVQGQSARRIADVLAAITAVSEPMPV